MELKYSLQHSKERVSEPYPEPVHILTTSVFILSCHLFLGLPTALSLSVSPTKIVYASCMLHVLLDSMSACEQTFDSCGQQSASLPLTWLPCRSLNLRVSRWHTSHGASGSSLANNSLCYVIPTPSSTEAHSSNNKFLMQRKCCYRVKDLYGNLKWCQLVIYSILKRHPKWKKRVSITSKPIILPANCWQVENHSLVVTFK
jgi:hypothetical protein